MDTTRPNLLEVPENPSSEELINHKLAKLLTREEAFPVYPGAERSTHPMWKHTDEEYRMRKSGVRPSVVKVFTIGETSWSEFTDTYSPNDEFEGFVGEVEREDGWTGRYSIVFDLSRAISYLLERDAV